MRYKALFAAIGAFLYDRVWLSKKSTILGILVYAAGEALIYFQGPNANPHTRLIAGLIATPFLAWKDKALKDGVIKMSIILLFFASAANAQTPSARARRSAAVMEAPPPPVDPPSLSSRFGGCVKNGHVCFGPTVSIALSAINISTKKVEGAFKPGLGFGMTVNPGKWSSYGLDAYFTIDPGPSQTASAALMAKFLNGYARVGVSKGFLGDTSWRIPLALGVDL